MDWQKSGIAFFKAEDDPIEKFIGKQIGLSGRFKEDPTEEAMYMTCEMKIKKFDDGMAQGAKKERTGLVLKSLH